MEGNTGYRLRSAHGDTIDPRQPLPIDSVEAQEAVSVAPTLTYNGKAAAGAISVNSLALKPVISIAGDQVASFWESAQNKVYEAFADGNQKKTAHWLLTLTETNGAAGVTIYDPSHNLENMFESVNGTVKRFILKAYDTLGGTLYGWVKGVSISSDVYTFEIANNRLTETLNWVGTLGSFDNTKLDRIEIYHYNSSIAFGTGTTLTEEVPCPKEYSKNWSSLLDYANSLTNGQYFVDYMRGRIIGKKADTTASEVVTYNVWSTTIGGSNAPTSAVDVNKWGGAALTAAAAPVDALSTGVIPGLTKNLNMGFNGTTWDRIKAGIVTATATLTGFLNTLPWAIYNVTPPTKTDGQGNALQSDSLGNLQTNLYTKLAGEDLTNDVMKVQVQATYTVPLTASALVKSGAGQLFGFVVNSCAAGATLKIWDNTSAATTVILDTMTFTTAVAEGPKVIALPATKFTTGCYFTIAVAAMSVTPLWN